MRYVRLRGLVAAVGFLGRFAEALELILELVKLLVGQVFQVHQAVARVLYAADELIQLEVDGAVRPQESKRARPKARPFG